MTYSSLPPLALALALCPPFAGAQSWTGTPLTVSNRTSAAYDSEPVTTGIPLPRGAATNASMLHLAADGAHADAQLLVSARWPDSSIRWVLADFQANAPAHATAQFALLSGAPTNSPSGIAFTNTAVALDVHTGTAAFHFDKADLRPAGLAFFARTGAKKYRAVPSAWEVEESGPMKLVVRATGDWRREPKLAKPLPGAVGFQARFTFFRGKDLARVQFTFRNHNSFGWDGARGKTVTLKELALATTFKAPRAASPLPKARRAKYVFGQGCERTFEIDVTSSGAASLRDTRFNADGSLAPGCAPPRPIAMASPESYRAAAAFGRVVPPPSAPTNAALHEALALFEKFQRAKVRAADCDAVDGFTGTTAWAHLAQDLSSWSDYGCLRWGGDNGPMSGNHYDWVYGMYLQAMRTGHPEFADAARVFAPSEIDLDIYHARGDGPAYALQKNWESRPARTSPANSFGPGRPSHTWLQGYALHWLLTGDRRGLDGVEDLAEGIRLYCYESFNGEGEVNTSEIRVQGWLTDNLVALYRLDPSRTFATTSFGTKTIPQTITNVLRSVFAREAAAGSHGYVAYGDDQPDPDLTQPLMNCYAIEPMAKACEEVFDDADPAYAARLEALAVRMTDYLVSVTYGGNTDGSGLYRPRQIPFFHRLSASLGTEGGGNPPYALMAANAAGFCHLRTGDPAYLAYARACFIDYCRYLNVAGGDVYVDPALRSPAGYNSRVYVDTESKIHGWSSRFGMFYLAAGP